MQELLPRAQAQSRLRTSGPKAASSGVPASQQYPPVSCPKATSVQAYGGKWALHLCCMAPSPTGPGSIVMFPVEHRHCTPYLNETNPERSRSIVLASPATAQIQTHETRSQKTVSGDQTAPRSLPCSRRISSSRALMRFSARPLSNCARASADCNRVSADCARASADCNRVSTDCNRVSCPR